MGGKSAPAAPPAVTPAPSFDMEGMMAMMMQMMGGMNQQAPAMPTVPDAPEVRRTPEVDWKERNAQLQARMKGDQFNDRARKKGRSDTIHTSPLLDEQPEETEEATSLLSETA